MEFKTLPKLRKGDKVAIVSPSFAAPGAWPHVYELGLQRIREVFELEPVAFPATAKLDASTEEKAADLIAAYKDPEIKAVISSLGGDIQVTYVKNLPGKIFSDNPKPFFGYSDTSHFQNHLWLNGVPSYYGGALMTEFAMHQQMNEFTVKYLKHALFDEGLIELEASPVFNDIGLNWNDPETLNQARRFQENDGWYWDGKKKVEGITWGGCLESIDEMLRVGVPIPALEQFSEVILFIETCEQISPASYVFRVLRALGERGILKQIKGILVGRPKAWEFDKQKSDEEKITYKKEQRETVIKTVRDYNLEIPIVQNLDFGHTAPQICLPSGRRAVIDTPTKKISVHF